MGTNVAFRREVLEEVGGFDEEYEYFLDETDVICRLVARGHAVRALDDGVVFHKFLPSHIRNSHRVPKNQYSILKNHCYFALMHGLPYSSHAELARDLASFVEKQRTEYRANVDMGRLTEADFTMFQADVHRAYDDAFARARNGGHRRQTAAWFRERPRSFLPFPLVRPSGERLHVCFMSQDYPPRPLGGVGRWVHSLATGLAEEGHVVRVLTRGEGHDTVDLEDGVWVHRLAVRHHALPSEGPWIPQDLWDYSATVREELHRIDERRPIDLVQFPNWDAEGIAAVMDRRIPTIVGLVTPLRTVLAHDPRLSDDDPKIKGLLASEEYCYVRADAFMASGPGILEEIDSRYGVRFPHDRTGVVPLGLPDKSGVVTPATSGNSIEILFVGRLEPRKGVDTLLACAPRLLSEHPNARLTLVGDDPQSTYRNQFLRDVTEGTVVDRVVFTGRLSDDELVERYASCDIFVAPSRFESFGLILLEAMMMGKPVVACDVGGMRMIVGHDENGYLVPPDDTEALGRALGRLVDSPDLRLRLGKRSRELYRERFSRERMVSAAEAFYGSLVSTLRASQSA
jgi:glycosyltransferase involved in cell wall biosynthesis